MRTTYKTVGVDKWKDVKVIFVQDGLDVFISTLEALDKLEGDVFDSWRRDPFSGMNSTMVKHSRLSRSSLTPEMKSINVPVLVRLS